MTVVKQRRYYFANVVAGAIFTLGIPRFVKPVREPESYRSLEYIAWMAIKVARLDVHNFADAREAELWANRIIQAMQLSELWSLGHGRMLHDLDVEQHFHLPMAA